MKKYIFLEGGIDGIGGSTIYVSSKAAYLTSNGWDVVVIHSVLHERIALENLKQYENNIIEQLIFDPNLFSSRRRKKILKRTLDIIGKADEYIIESNSHFHALWGETISSILRCKHFVFLLGENLSYIQETYLPFYYYKLNRRELCGSGKMGVKQLFRNKLPDDKNLSLYAYQGTIVQDYECSSLTNIEHHKTLTCISRLEKPCVQAIVNELFVFLKKHDDTLFNLIFVGGADPVTIYQEIRKKFSPLSNVCLFLTGPLHPVPKKLFQITDVFISSAGCAELSYGEGSATISVDADDNMAIGVLGYTTLNSRNRENEPPIKISCLLDDIIFNNLLDGQQFIPAASIYKESSYETHLDFINNSDKTIEYFPVDKINRCNHFFIKKLAISFLGAHYCYLIQSAIRNKNVKKSCSK